MTNRRDAVRPRAVRFWSVRLSSWNVGAVSTSGHSPFPSLPAGKKPWQPRRGADRRVSCHSAYALPPYPRRTLPRLPGPHPPLEASCSLSRVAARSLFDCKVRVDRLGGRDEDRFRSYGISARYRRTPRFRLGGALLGTLSANSSLRRDTVGGSRQARSALSALPSR